MSGGWIITIVSTYLSCISIFPLDAPEVFGHKDYKYIIIIVHMHGTNSIQVAFYVSLEGKNVVANFLYL